MPAKNEGEATDVEDVSGADSDHSNSSQNRESTDEEANEMDSDDSSDMDFIEMDRIRSEYCQDLGTNDMFLKCLYTLYRAFTTTLLTSSQPRTAI